MTTTLGKELRKLRIERDERILDMAGKIDCSTAFISAVETGRKTPPAGFEELIIKAYGLASQVAGKIRAAADESRRTFVLEPTSQLGRDTAGLMARKMNSLSDEQLEKIKDILRKGHNE
ncbi:helix-turn-helix domain-containing protein [Mesorhizobium australicum]|uniref:helix-turn-helix domain-containing protein n=1 Tax=Mesorhizobium australicum TaxID=536018 RepID=UPI00333C71E0